MRMQYRKLLDQSTARVSRLGDPVYKWKCGEDSQRRLFVLKKKVIIMETSLDLSIINPSGPISKGHL